MIDISDLKAKYFIFESKFKIEETPSHLGTSMTSEDDIKFEDYEIEDNMDPLFCSPRFFPSIKVYMN